MSEGAAGVFKQYYESLHERACDQYIIKTDAVSA